MLLSSGYVPVWLLAVPRRQGHTQRGVTKAFTELLPSCVAHSHRIYINYNNNNTNDYNNKNNNV